MSTCRDPAHPHCTVWVLPGEPVCAHGHPQPPLPAGAVPPPASGAGRAVRPHLHVSGFDPRAAGGRHAVRLELRAMPPDCPGTLTMLLKSRLRLGAERIDLVRGAHGEWRPAVVEFTSRGLEHGQYPVEVELHARLAGSRTWVCTLVLPLPRADATLAEIHDAFLATHKNVRVLADDGSIARVNAHAGGGRLDIDVRAHNAGIAQLDVDAAGGKVDVGLPAIAWDEELVEIDLPAPQPHPFPARAACILNPGGACGLPRHVRLFAQDEWILGRYEWPEPQAHVLLAHRGADGHALTQRLSARHALIRRGRRGLEIEDVSRFGLLVDGVAPGKRVPVPLREGMRLEFADHIRDIVALQVAALPGNGVLLRRADAGAPDECFWLIEPGREPDGVPGLPALAHRDGGFWQGQAPLVPGPCAAPLPAEASFIGSANPELWTPRAPAPDRRRATANA